MRKLINLIALLIMASSVTWAQDKKSFTLEDLMPGGNNYYNLLPQNLYGLQWWGDVCINADIEEVKTIQPANGKENVLITLPGFAAKPVGFCRSRQPCVQTSGHALPTLETSASQFA